MRFLGLITNLFTGYHLEPHFDYIWPMKVDFLIEARKKKGYTKEFLADMLKIHRLTLASYEKGDRSPDFELFKSWCDQLDYDILIVKRDHINK